jgi:3-oxoacyl-[acyl-carrier protein] reductase
MVTVASLAARQPSAMAGAAYAAAKSSILGMTRSLAAELGPRSIRVNAIAPGLVLTERLSRLFASITAEEREALVAAIPLRRLPEVREVVEPLLFLASSQSSYITGTVLDVNGGRFMTP